MTADSIIEHGDAEHQIKATPTVTFSRIGEPEQITVLVDYSKYTPAYGPDLTLSDEFRDRFSGNTDGHIHDRIWENVLHNLNKGPEWINEQFKSQGYFSVDYKDQSYRITPEDIEITTVDYEGEWKDGINAKLHYMIEDGVARLESISDIDGIHRDKTSFKVLRLVAPSANVVNNVPGVERVESVSVVKEYLDEAVDVEWIE